MKMRHIQSFNSAADVQAALNNEELGKPYVALVSGTSLDYNSLEPVQPCHIGEWSDDGEGNYTFRILDTGNTAWENPVNIGSLMQVYYLGEWLDMNVKLESPLSEPNYWTLTFEGAGDPSESPIYQFNEGIPDNWVSDVMTEPNYSNSTISVSWDGVDTFVFSAHPDYPLVMETINPDCE